MRRSGNTVKETVYTQFFCLQVEGGGGGGLILNFGLGGILGGGERSVGGGGGSGSGNTVKETVYKCTSNVSKKFRMGWGGVQIGWVDTKFWWGCFQFLNL